MTGNEYAKSHGWDPENVSVLRYCECEIYQMISAAYEAGRQEREKFLVEIRTSHDGQWSIVRPIRFTGTHSEALALHQRMSALYGLMNVRIVPDDL